MAFVRILRLTALMYLGAFLGHGFRVAYLRGYRDWFDGSQEFLFWTIVGALCGLAAELCIRNRKIVIKSVVTLLTYKRPHER